MTNKIENISDEYLEAFAPISVDKYDRVFKLAKERALNIFEEWNKIAGVFPRETSYYYEVEGCIIDAVHCGLQRGLGIQVSLISEEPNR